MQKLFILRTLNRGTEKDIVLAQDLCLTLDHHCRVDAQEDVGGKALALALTLAAPGVFKSLFHFLGSM